MLLNLSLERSEGTTADAVAGKQKSPSQNKSPVCLETLWAWSDTSSTSGTTVRGWVNNSSQSPDVGFGLIISILLCFILASEMYEHYKEAECHHTAGLKEWKSAELLHDFLMFNTNNTQTSLLWWKQICYLTNICNSLTLWLLYLLGVTALPQEAKLCTTDHTYY